MSRFQFGLNLVIKLEEVSSCVIPASYRLLFFKRYTSVTSKALALGGFYKYEDIPFSLD